MRPAGLLFLGRSSLQRYRGGGVGNLYLLGAEMVHRIRSVVHSESADDHFAVVAVSFDRYLRW